MKLIPTNHKKHQQSITSKNRCSGTPRQYSGWLKEKLVEKYGALLKL
jgi:hypothetical protein